MKKSLLTLALCAALPLSSAHAELTFNGFANIVAGKASSGDSLWGYDDDIDFKQDSLFALQTSADLGNNLSMTAQIMSRGSDDWDTEFEWAYLTYTVNEQTQVMVGRQRAPLFMFSDYLDVSYSYAWITPPDSVYATEFSKFNGVSVLHNFNIGEFDASVQVLGGSEEQEMQVALTDVVVEFDEMFGANLTLNRDWLTLRAGILSANVTVPESPVDGLAAQWQNVPGLEFVGEELQVEDDQFIFAELGFQIDYNNWLIIAEATHVEYDEITIDKEDAMFVTAGYRFDDVLVHLTYGMVQSDQNPVRDLLPETTEEPLATMVDLSKQLIDFREQDKSYFTLGARWDFHESAALKVEYTYHDDDLIDENTGLLRTALVTVF